LKLTCDETLSNFAFKIHLHRYSEVTAAMETMGMELDGRAVQVDNIKTRVESAYGFSA
jgi:hypothetical protein